MTPNQVNAAEAEALRFLAAVIRARLATDAAREKMEKQDG